MVDQGLRGAGVGSEEGNYRMNVVWGLLGPEHLGSSRRTRTLGLGAAVRYFNDRAVPGLGGVWFGKQLLLSTLGVVVAEKARENGANVNNIQVANAIEALACQMAFKQNKWNPDSRLRGSQKLRGKDDDFTFALVKQPNFYVTQPMRMATVQALPALGLVRANGSRFNAFEATQESWDFIESSGVNLTALVKWVYSGDSNGLGQTHHQDKLHPTSPLEPDAKRLLKARLQQGSAAEPKDDTKRRRRALDWLDWIASVQPNQPLTLERKPAQLDDAHWHDIVAGALFFKVQAAAIAALAALETGMGHTVQKYSLGQGAQMTHPQLQELKIAAQLFLKHKSTNKDATRFCEEFGSESPEAALKALVARDDAVLRLDGEQIRRGPAFRGKTEPPSPVDDEEAETPNGKIPLPDDVSFRLRNLYLLNLDLNGKLDFWINENRR